MQRAIGLLSYTTAISGAPILLTNSLLLTDQAALSSWSKSVFIRPVVAQIASVAQPLSQPVIYLATTSASPSALVVGTGTR